MSISRKVVCFKLALKQGFSALVTVISLIYSAVCDAGSCLDLQQPAVEPFLSSTGLLLVFLRGNADLASFARANQRSKRSLPASEQSVGGLPQGMFGGQSEQGSEAGTEEEFVSAALGSDESVSSPEPEAEDGIEALPAWADAVLTLVAEGARLTAAQDRQVTLALP